MIYQTFGELMGGYFVHQLHLGCPHKERSGATRSWRVASQWILKQAQTPTRDSIMQRMRIKCSGDFQPGAAQANKELALQRAAFRWGIYNNRWEGGDPTVGIKKFKTKKRKRIAKFLEVKTLLDYFDFPEKDLDMRDRAIYGLSMFTGCRPSEIRMAVMGSIVPYGTGGCWNKGKTKNGEDHEIPLPSQAMGWLSAWLRVRAQRKEYQHSLWIFPGQEPSTPLSDASMRKGWEKIRTTLRLTGLWNYDLRRTLASYMSNELRMSDTIIQAILNHYDQRALGHYCHVSFDSLVPVIQKYADWLYGVAEQPSTTMPSIDQGLSQGVLASDDRRFNPVERGVAAGFDRK